MKPEEYVDYKGIDRIQRKIRRNEAKTLLERVTFPIIAFWGYVFIRSLIQTAMIGH